MDYIVTLPSNSSFWYFPNNTCAEFKTQLAKPINLDTPYEVGVKEVLYTKAFSAIHLPDDYRKVTLFTSSWILETFYLPHRYYTRPVDLIEDYSQYSEIYMEKEVQQGQGWTGYLPTLAMSKEGHPLLDLGELVATNKDPVPIFVDMHPELQSLLGFVDMLHAQRRAYKKKRTYIVGTRPSAVHESRYTPKNFMLYSNIVTESHVGHALVPLLRVCEVPASVPLGSVVTLTYDNPIYHPVKTSHIDVIEILLKTDYGTNIPFQEGGRTIVTLHLRPRKPT